MKTTHERQRFAADPWHVMPASVTQVQQEGPHVITYRCQLTNPEDQTAYQFTPGQFNMLYVPGIGEAAISASGVGSNPGTILHTIREVGGVTGALAKGTSLRSDDGSGELTMGIGIRGPFGRGWPMNECKGRDVVLVAGGIGLAPLRPVIEELCSDRASRGCRTLVMGSRTPEDLLYRSSYDSWRSRGWNVMETVDQADGDWRGSVGLVTELLGTMPLPRPTETILMTCGPERMMQGVAAIARQRGIPDAGIWVSLERNMNCAIGLCGHCQMGPEFLCKDGPVFRYDRVASWMRVRDL